MMSFTDYKHFLKKVCSVSEQNSEIKTNKNKLFDHLLKS